jgi:molybdopterin-guanine dinucleotide biosynthesis protein A
MTSGSTFSRGISAAVLVGGLSKRLGRDKVLLEFDGQTLIHRSVTLLTSLFENVFVIGHHRPEFDELGIRVIEDIVPEKGALGGLYTAVENSPTPSVFVVAADMPFVTQTIIDKVLQFQGQADAVIPRGPRGFEPLCALYSRNCATPMKDAIEGGTFKIMAALEGLNIVTPEITIENGEQDPFANINYPKDVAVITGKRE